MSFFDQFSKVTKDFGNKAQEMTKDLKDKFEEQQAISKLNSQITEQNNLIKSIYAAIGEKYYHAHKDDELCDMQQELQKITDAVNAVEEYRSEIRKLKNESVCAACGATVSKEAVFCPSCGAKIEKPQPAKEENKKPEEKSVCAVCGEPIDEGAMFCTNCGAAVKKPDMAKEEKADDDAGNDETE